VPTGDVSANQAGRRILVVDDNRDAAASLAMMLSLLGHDTRTAYSGLVALDVAAAFRPDVVLLNIGMPKLNGYDEARHIRQDGDKPHVTQLPQVHLLQLTDTAARPAGAPAE
jgi:CheY-like chemotaxis protein